MRAIVNFIKSIFYSPPKITHSEYVQMIKDAIEYADSPEFEECIKRHTKGLKRSYETQDSNNSEHLRP